MRYQDFVWWELWIPRSQMRDPSFRGTKGPFDIEVTDWFAKTKLNEIENRVYEIQHEANHTLPRLLALRGTIASEF